MRFLRLDDDRLVDVDFNNALICPMMNRDNIYSSSVYCTNNCCWFKQEKDRDCSKINILCKDFFIGVLK